MKSPKKPLTLPTPPETDRERASNAELRRAMAELGAAQQQRNLDNAVLLAAEAARGRGDLIEHFAELGRRFGGTTVKSTRATLRVVKGGVA